MPSFPSKPITHPQLVVDRVCFIQTDNVWMLNFGQDVNLNHVIAQIFLILQCAHLSRSQLFRLPVLCLVHLAKRTIAQLTDHVPEIGRICVHADVVEDALLLRLSAAQVENLLQVV